MVACLKGCIHARATPGHPRATVSNLSCLEQAIWLQKLKRPSNLEVALTLSLDERTVKEHLRRIAQKFRALAAVVDEDKDDHGHAGMLLPPPASSLRVGPSPFRDRRGPPLG